MKKAWIEELRTKDKYDEAIEYLTENPEYIEDAWSNPEAFEGRGGELFGFVGPDWTDNESHVRYGRDMSVSGTCGCLQQIRAGYEGVKDDLPRGVIGMWTAIDSGMDSCMTLSHWPRMWEAIASDKRLPTESADIHVEDLPVFAEWQRVIDDLRREDGMEVPY